MNDIKLHLVTHGDTDFLFHIMNVDSILEALNEIPTQLCDWKEAIQEWCKDDDEEDYIISDGENTVGWLGINGLFSADHIVYLKMIAILPGYHNKGVGERSIREIIEMLRRKNYSKIVLYTDQDNHKAKACYRKCGFEITETFMDKMSNGKMVARCKMELLL